MLFAPWTRNGYELTRSMHPLPRSTFFKSDCPRGYALLSTKWDCCSFAFSWGKCLEDHLSERKFLAESNPRLSQPKTKRSRGGKIRSLTDYLNSLPDRAHWIELELLVLWEGISLCKERNPWLRSTNLKIPSQSSYLKCIESCWMPS